MGIKTDVCGPGARFGNGSLLLHPSVHEPECPRRTVPCAPAGPAPYSGNRPQSIQDGVQIQTAYREDMVAMQDGIPTKAAVAPKQPRKVLVLCKAAGFVHSSIPLAAETVKAMGEKTGAYTATITYDSADITASNLAQYDAIVLDSTTLAFLDDPKDAAATEARKKALLDFVRNGKGLVGIHAAIDTYHTSDRTSPNPPTGTWPEFNKMVGGYFKFHWVYPQLLNVKIDDPKSPLTTMFHGQEFQIHDETYTMVQDSFSRRNAHVLTSVDYAKMSDADKAKETFKRTDGDYALSWIHREGKGRVFIEVLGHSEHIYANTPMMEHLLAGLQYAIGDLKAGRLAKYEVTRSFSSHYWMSPMPTFPELLTLFAVCAPLAAQTMPSLKRQPTPARVVEEHMAAFTGCDWPRLMAQFPDNVEFFGPNGQVVRGKAALGQMFAQVVKEPAQGGTCGLKVVAEHTFIVGDVVNVQWRADSPLLKEPYRGADAYETHDGLMAAQVTTWNPAELKWKTPPTALKK